MFALSMYRLTSPHIQKSTELFLTLPYLLRRGRHKLILTTTEQICSLSPYHILTFNQ